MPACSNDGIVNTQESSFLQQTDTPQDQPLDCYATSSDTNIIHDLSQKECLNDFSDFVPRVSDS